MGCSMVHWVQMVAGAFGLSFMEVGTRGLRQAVFHSGLGFVCGERSMVAWLVLVGSVGVGCVRR